MSGSVCDERRGRAFKVSYPQIFLKVDGLGPVKSDIFVTNYGARSGGYYNGLRDRKRSCRERV